MTIVGKNHLIVISVSLRLTRSTFVPGKYPEVKQKSKAKYVHSKREEKRKKKKKKNRAQMIDQHCFSSFLYSAKLTQHQ